MIKVRALEQFTLGEFCKIKNIERVDKNKDESGRIFQGDIFECDEEMVEYLTKTNRFTIENPERKFVEIVEYIPEEKPKKEEAKEVKKKTTTNRKKKLD